MILPFRERSENWRLAMTDTVEHTQDSKELIPSSCKGVLSPAIVETSLGTLSVCGSTKSSVHVLLDAYFGATGSQLTRLLPMHNLKRL